MRRRDENIVLTAFLNKQQTCYIITNYITNNNKKIICTKIFVKELKSVVKLSI